MLPKVGARRANLGLWGATRFGVGRGKTKRRHGKSPLGSRFDEVGWSECRRTLVQENLAKQHRIPWAGPGILHKSYSRPRLAPREARPRKNCMSVPGTWRILRRTNHSGRCTRT